MINVCILGLHNSMATTIFGPMDILNQAGRLWNRLNKEPLTPYFDVTVVSADGKPVRCANSVFISPHSSINDVEKADLIIVSSATYIDKILEKSPELVGWIKAQYDKGAHIASICTGVFLLAHTGLLDGKSATLHWGFTKEFKEKYPRVILDQDQMFIDHGRLYCSAGVNAGMDLTLYLVEKFLSKKNAAQSAKTMILDYGRKKQTPYESFLRSKGHGDIKVVKIQNWIEKNFTRKIDYEFMADKFGLGRRSMERRFKRACGLTPLGYLQRIRVEKAANLLVKKNLTFNEISYTVGYDDISFFRKLFTRVTGLRPKEYQKKFSGFTD